MVHVWLCAFFRRSKHLLLLDINKSLRYEFTQRSCSMVGVWAFGRKNFFNSSPSFVHCICYVRLAHLIWMAHSKALITIYVHVVMKWIHNISAKKCEKALSSHAFVPFATVSFNTSSLYIYTYCVQQESERSILQMDWANTQTRQSQNEKKGNGNILENQLATV